MPTKKTKVGIVGVGYVGGAAKAWFGKQKSVELFLYDKYKNVGSVEAVNQADIIFVCVPTPYHEKQGFNDGAVLDALANIKKGKIVVIKSTVLPSSTEKYQKQFSHLKILFNPEFLVAKTAKRDFLRPDRQIIGYTRQSKTVASKVMKLLPKAPYMQAIAATEAELVKYFCNSFLATRVVFANQIFDLCQALKADYTKVKAGAAADPRIGGSHFAVFSDGYRGYGGACLPKDTKALIDFSNQVGAPQELLQVVDRINDRLVKKNKTLSHA